MKQNASLGRMPPSGQQFVASLSEVTQANVYFCVWLLFEEVLYPPHLDGYLSNTNLAQSYALAWHPTMMAMSFQLSFLLRPGFINHLSLNSYRQPILLATDIRNAYILYRAVFQFGITHKLEFLSNVCRFFILEYLFCILLTTQPARLHHLAFLQPASQPAINP